MRFFARDGDDSLFGEREEVRAQLAELFSPARYFALWSYLLPNSMGAEGQDGDEHEPQERGGVTLEELEASAVRDPTCPERQWLLHRKVFRLVRDPDTLHLVADEQQRVGVCG